MTPSPSIIVLAAQTLGALISERVQDLAGKVTVVQEAPTAEKGYPVAAVMPEPAFRFEVEHDVEVRDAGDVAIMTGDGRALMTAGAVRTSLRVWLAARTPAQRARLGAAIARLFSDDELAPSRLTLSLTNIEVDGFTPPTAWPVYCFLDEGEWQEEQVFSERRWVFLRCSLDVPILLLRDEAWRVAQMVAALTAGTNADTATTDEVLVDDDGTITTAP